MYNFDEIRNRKDTFSTKWNAHASDDIIALWIADMDFPAPKEVAEAIKSRMDHEIFGYTLIDDEFYNVFIAWMKKRYNFVVKREHIVTTSCVVASLGIAIASFASKDDGVLVMPPVYPPFLDLPRLQGLRRVDVPLIHEENENTYKIDFDLFEEKAKEAKIFILCSPHNPVGRVWTHDELKKMADIIIKNDMIVLSDEIHSDIIMPGYKHLPMGSISEVLNERLVSIYAPNKTFNIPGMPTSYNIIPNKELRDKFTNTLQSLGLTGQSITSTLASKAAYKYGEKWFDEVLDYIHKNYLFVCEYLKENIPNVKISKVEGTYLAWLDFRALSLGDAELKDFLLNKAKVNLKSGSDFDSINGLCFMRFNMATSRLVIKDALDRIKNAIEGLK